MWTKHSVIQKIELPSSVRLYQAHDQNIVWSFERDRGIRPDDDRDLFPFLFQGNLAFSKSNAGRETSVQYRRQKDVVFRDDYSIPEGFVIGILFPPEYVPAVFKFKDKPYIPTGGMNVASSTRTPPGNFDVFFNRKTKQSAVVFLIHQPTVFGFSCIAPHISTLQLSESSEQRYSGSDPLDLTVAIGADEANYQPISSDDLRPYARAFRNGADLTELSDKVNELIRLLKPENVHRNSEELAATQKAVKTAVDAIGFAGSLTTILDSYHAGGIAARVAGRILAYFLL